MVTISELQTKLNQFNQFAKTHNDPHKYMKKWNELFQTPLSLQSAKSFEMYYKEMRSKHTTRRQQRQHGGSGAPLDYSMTPGLNIQAYGRFPIEAGTDPASIRDLDVYFRDSLTADCGVKDSSLTVPPNMGSNQVGGGGNRSRRNRRSTNRRGRSGGRGGRGGRTQRRRRLRLRQRGGDLLESITARMPFVHNSSVAPNMLQSAQNAYTGGTEPVPAPSDPSIHTWEPRTHGVGGLINPGAVAYVPNDVGKLANPAPWMSSS